MFLKPWNHVWNYQFSFCQIITAGCNSGSDPHHIKTPFIFVLNHRKTPSIRSNSRNVLTSSGAKPPAFSELGVCLQVKPSVFVLWALWAQERSPGCPEPCPTWPWALPGLGQLLWAQQGGAKLPQHPHWHPSLPASALSKRSCTSHHTFINTAKKTPTFLGPEHPCFPIFFPYFQTKRSICYSPVSIQLPERSS